MPTRTKLKTKQKVTVINMITLGILIVASSVVIGSFLAGIAGASANLAMRNAQRPHKAKVVRQVQRARRLEALGKNVLLRQASKNSKRPKKELVVEQNSEIVFNVKIPEVNREQVQLKEQFDCTKLSMPDSGITADIGYPELPIITTYLELPFTARNVARVEVISSKSETFKLEQDICPKQEDPPDLVGYDDSSIPLVQSNDVYQKNLPYPDNIVLAHETKILRKHRILPVTIYPVQYNPVSKAIKIHYDIDLRVSFPGHMTGKKLRRDPRWQAESFLKIVNNLVLNPESPTKEEKMEAAAMTVRSDVEYLIITHEDFVETQPVLDLVAHKQSKGLTVDIRAYPTGTSANRIAEDIETLYDTSPNLLYVLIIGDVEQVPTHYKHDHPYGPGESPIATDLYYGTVDGDVDPEDYWPDLFVGRLPVSTEAELATMVEKIIAYETTEPTGDWTSNVLLAAYFQDDSADGEANRFFTQTSEIVANFLYNEQVVPCADLYSCSTIKRVYTTSSPDPTCYYGCTEAVPSELEFDGTTEDIINYINQGVFLVNHRDHGSTSGWGDPDFHVEDVSQLNNFDPANPEVKLPIVFSINCRSGWFDLGEDDCLGEALLKEEDGGAVAYFGSSRISYSGYNDELDKGFIHALWPQFDPYGDDYETEVSGLNHLGAVLNSGKFFMYGKRVLTDAFGYPWSATGEKTLVEFEEFNLLGDPEMGLTTLEPSLFIASTMSIDDSIAVSPDNNDNAVLDAGETVNLIPTLRAFDETAINTQATISVSPGDDPLGCVVDISDGQAYFGEILSGTEVTATTDLFTISISESCQPSDAFLLTMAITADGYSVTRKLNFELYNHKYDSNWSLTGHEDEQFSTGVKIDPGESYQLDLEIWTKHRARNVEVELMNADYHGQELTDGCLYIASPTQTIGEIEVMEPVNLLFQFTLPPECPDYYIGNLKLEIREDGYPEPTFVPVRSFFARHYGDWPFFYFKTAEQEARVASVADLDTSYPGQEIVYNAGMIRSAIHSDASEYWGVTSYGGGIYSGEAVADINNDGLLETVSNSTYTLKSFDYDGPLDDDMYVWQYYDIDYSPSYPNIAQIDASTPGLETVLLDSGYSGSEVHCLNADGSVNWISDPLDPDNDPGTVGDSLTRGCAVADINNDYRYEIICSVTSGFKSSLYCLNDQGDVLWQSPPIEEVVFNYPVIADFDQTRDGLEIVWAAGSDPYAYYSDGSLFWQRDWITTANERVLLSVADLYPEYPGPEIVATGYDRVSTYKANGEPIIGEFRVESGEGLNYYSPTLIANIDSDEQMEVLVATNDGALILNHDLTPHEEYGEAGRINYDLPNDAYFQYYLIAVDDIVENGKLQLLLLNKGKGFYDLIGFDVEYMEEKLAWSRHSANNQRTNCYGCESDLICTDQDGDGYSLEGGVCGAVDCDDIEAEINPGVYEGPPLDPLCGDYIDNDCDGQIDMADSSCWECSETYECYDDDVCISGTCIDHFCEYRYTTSFCDDGDPATVDDRCVEGVCQGKPEGSVSIITVLDHEGEPVSNVLISARDEEGIYIIQDHTDQEGRAYLDIDPEIYSKAYFRITHSISYEHGVTFAHDYTETLELPAAYTFYRPEHISYLTITNPGIVEPGGRYLIYPVFEGEYWGSTQYYVDPPAGEPMVHPFYLLNDREYAWEVIVYDPDMTIRTGTFTPPYDHEIILGVDMCADEDGDDYGSPATIDCINPEEDCDDADPLIYPGADEICDDGIDQDCDGLIDMDDVDCIDPVASFEYEIDPLDPLIVHFTDTSVPQERIIGWRWTFDKPTLAFGEEFVTLQVPEQNPSVTFQGGGIYTAALEITLDDETIVETSQVFKIGTEERPGYEEAVEIEVE